jgi:hypothetical protein
MAERRYGRIVIALACLIVAVELWAAGTHAAHIARYAWRIAGVSPYPVQEADFDPFAQYAMPEALVRARAIIPADATYAVVLGRDLPPSARAAPIAFEFALLPRRYTRDLTRAQWIIAYHTPSEGLGVRYSREIGLGPDVNVVEVTR